MKIAVKNRRNLEKFSRNALRYAKSLSWDKIADRTYELCDSLIK